LAYNQTKGLIFIGKSGRIILHFRLFLSFVVDFIIEDSMHVLASVPVVASSTAVTSTAATTIAGAATS